MGGFCACSCILTASPGFTSGKKALLRIRRELVAPFEILGVVPGDTTNRAAHSLLGEHARRPAERKVDAAFVPPGRMNNARPAILDICKGSFASKEEREGEWGGGIG